MENAKTLTNSNRMPALWVGILMCIASVILFAIGMAIPMRMGVWIASVVMGAFACLLLSIAAHSYSGAARMAAAIFLVVQAVFITIIATIYFL